MVKNMADELKKLVSLDNLTSYDTLIKKYIGDADAVVDAKSIKKVVVNGDNIEFYKNTAEGASADFTVPISSSDVENLKKILKGYADEGSVATAVADAKKAGTDAQTAVTTLDESLKAVAKSGAASDVTIADDDNKITATTVEGALAEIVGKADANATAIASINNSESGILKQAKDYTDALANGQVKTNKEAIEAINDSTTGIEAVAKKYTDDEIKKVTDKIGTIPSTATATTVVEYAKEVADAAAGDASEVAKDLADYKTTNDAAVAAAKKTADDEVTRATKAEEALDGRIDDLEDLIGEVEEGKTVMGIVAANQTADRKYTDDAISALGSVLNFKGTVATVSALPTEGAKVGDVYHVTEKSAEYVYTTEGWEELGSVIDLSAYETIEGAEGKISTAKSEAIQAAKDYADGLDEAMDARMDAVESAIGEGGSVQDKIDASIALLDSVAALEEGEDYLTGVTITDGKITAHTAGVFNFDEKGAAEAVRTEFTPYKYDTASITEINALFSDDEA